MSLFLAKHMQGLSHTRCRSSRIACEMTASTFYLGIAQAVLKHACLASREVLGVIEEVRTHQ